MEYSIRGERIEVTDALRDYVAKRMSRIDKYFTEPINSEASVTLSVVRELHGVEVTIPLPGVLVRAEAKTDDMYASIDSVVDKLERQIRKHKTKVNRKFRQDGTLHAVFKENETTPSPSVSNLGEEEDGEFEIVRTKRFTFKPMDVEEAILQMNMIGHSFFVFANGVTEEVNVVYKRDDGKYGLIEPAL